MGFFLKGRALPRKGDVNIGAAGKLRVGYPRDLRPGSSFDISRRS